KDYIFLENNNVYFENSLSSKISTEKFFNLKSSFFAKYYFTGYRQNDFRTEINLSKTINTEANPIYLDFKTQFSYYKPDYFEQNYYSNHYMWENNFDNSERLDATLSINIPKYKLKASVNNNLINNYVYYGTISTPSQYDSNINITTLSIEKNLILNNFHIKNIIYWQKSSNQNIISLPELAAYHSIFLEIDLKTKSYFYFGYEIRYSTSYKAKSFNPSTGHFYQEIIDAPTIGNYPYLNLFFNMKIKRNVLLSFKYEHLNYGMMDTQFPMQINHYPVYGSVFRFAVRWTFKN
ncbi:MAG: putative porin, partial [Chlorobi bacterium]|nr:putative porin [Chlorobiota bacterium]